VDCAKAYNAVHRLNKAVVVRRDRTLSDVVVQIMSVPPMHVLGQCVTRRSQALAACASCVLVLRNISEHEINAIRAATCTSYRGHDVARERGPCSDLEVATCGSELAPRALIIPHTASQQHQHSSTHGHHSHSTTYAHSPSRLLTVVVASRHRICFRRHEALDMVDSGGFSPIAIGG
jgi:hypothetical protein